MNELEFVEVARLDKLGTDLKPLVNFAHSPQLRNHLLESWEVRPDVVSGKVAIADAMAEFVNRYSGVSAGNTPVIVATIGIGHPISFGKLGDLADLPKPTISSLRRVFVRSNDFV